MTMQFDKHGQWYDDERTATWRETAVTLVCGGVLGLIFFAVFLLAMGWA